MPICTMRSVRRRLLLQHRAGSRRAKWRCGGEGALVRQQVTTPTTAASELGPAVVVAAQGIICRSLFRRLLPPRWPADCWVCRLSRQGGEQNTQVGIKAGNALQRCRAPLRRCRRLKHDQVMIGGGHKAGPVGTRRSAHCTGPE